MVTFNRRSLVDACLASIAAQDHQPDRVILIDNASTDGTAAFVRERHPRVEVIELPANRGPNPARNRALTAARTEFVLLVDDDALLAPDCLRHLVAAMDEPDVAVAAPLAVFRDRPDLVQYGGCHIHYVGGAITASGPLGRFTANPAPYTVTTVAGVTMLVRRRAALEVGLFDEDLFFGWTDGEFCARLTLAGHRCVQVPSAIVRHDARPRGTVRVFHQVRNRWLFVLRLYSGRTLALAAPALLGYEVALAALLLLKRSPLDYLRANAAVLRALPDVVRKRRRTQALRRVPDSGWLTAGPLAASPALLGAGPLARLTRLANALFDGYWRLVRWLV